MRLNLKKNVMFLLKVHKKNKIKYGKKWIAIHGDFGPFYKKNDSSKLISWKNNIYDLNMYKDKYISNKFIKNIYVLCKYSMAGYSLKFRLIGVGYRLNSFYKDNFLYLNLRLGYSHECIVKIPSTINYRIIKTQSSIFLISGLDINEINKLGFFLHKLRSPEPYKGKGLRYYNEIIQKKEGKKSNL